MNKKNNRIQCGKQNPTNRFYLLLVVVVEMSGDIASRPGGGKALVQPHLIRPGARFMLLIIPSYSYRNFM